MTEVPKHLRESDRAFEGEDIVTQADKEAKLPATERAERKKATARLQADVRARRRAAQRTRQTTA